MNPSYVRIRVPIAEAMPRFSDWTELAQVAPPREVKSRDAVDEACEDGQWRCRVAVFVYESDGWTVFEDLTGHLASFPAARWQALAAGDELVFAGYNDAIGYGQLIVIQSGRIVREFLDDQQDPRQNVNRGKLDFEARSPVTDWIGAASFVDEDAVAATPDRGLLWMFD